jgi:hypothetical protein
MVLLTAGITQELIDDTRLGIENNMLSDLRKLSDGSSIINTYRGANGETLVGSLINLLQLNVL